MVSRRVSSNCTIINISRAGALVTIGKTCGHVLPGLGVEIVLQIALAAVTGFAARCLHCEGKVVRVSKSVAQPMEIALKVSRMEFRNAQGASVRISPRRWIDGFQLGPPSEVRS